MENRELIILRGLQGSGKSTLANLFNTDAICSADDYFMRDGKYEWSGDKLRQAHEYSIKKCKDYMIIGTSIIVIDNTSPRERDLKPYTDLAEQFNYRVHSVVVENRHGGVNIHNVDPENIEKTKRRFNIKL